MALDVLRVHFQEEEEGAKKTKKSKSSRFIDDIAAEDGGDEDDDDEDVRSIAPSFQAKFHIYLIPLLFYCSYVLFHFAPNSSYTSVGRAVHLRKEWEITLSGVGTSHARHAWSQAEMHSGNHVPVHTAHGIQGSGCSRRSMSRVFKNQP